jgi:hypothetical protein
MYSCGRRTVCSSPDSARVRSPCACQRMSATGLSGLAPLAESLTILSTPARVAASMNAASIVGWFGSSRAMTNARSTPSSAPGRVSGRSKSPTTASTPRAARSVACSSVHTIARRRVPWRTSSSTSATPTSSRTPVTRMALKWPVPPILSCSYPPRSIPRPSELPRTLLPRGTYLSPTPSSALGSHCLAQCGNAAQDVL